jgi:hypothetical protein
VAARTVAADYRMVVSITNENNNGITLYFDVNKFHKCEAKTSHGNLVFD